MTTRALVTGAGGFIGRHLVRELAAAGVEVVTAGVKVGGADHRRVEDMCSPDVWTGVLGDVRPTFIYHLAAVSGASDVGELLRVNAGCAGALIRAMEAGSCSEAVLVLAGSAAEYGGKSTDELPLSEDAIPTPDSEYGVSKYAQTLLGLAAARRGLHVVVPRMFNVVGPGMREGLALADFARQIADIETGTRPPVLSVGNLSTSRDFVDVRDVAAVLPALAASPAARGRVVNVCSGHAVRMQDLVQQLIATSGRDIRVEVDPRRYMPADIPCSYGSAALLESLTGRRLRFDPDTACRDILRDVRGR